MNEVQRTAIVTSVVISSTILLSCGLTILVLLPATSENLPIFGISLMVTPSAIAMLLFVLGLLARIFEQSNSNSREFQAVTVKRIHMDNRKEMRWNHRFILSCAPIKAKFGSINFIESETPLNCIDFSNALTVNLVLLSQ